MGMPWGLDALACKELNACDWPSIPGHGRRRAATRTPDQWYFPGARRSNGERMPRPGVLAQPHCPVMILFTTDSRPWYSVGNASAVSAAEYRR